MRASIMAFAGAVALTTACSLATTVQLREIMRSDVSAYAGTTSPWFMGRNVASVAWNGTDAFIGGQSFNTDGSAISKFRPNAADQTTNALLSGRFGFLTQNATRGVQDLALRSDGTLGVAWDNGSANNNGLRLFDSDGNALGTASFGTRGNGVNFDPNDGRLTAINLGSGRVSKLNDDGTTYNDGTKNWDTATGPIINPNSTGGTTHRDMTMDLAGNLYYRAQNSVQKAIRAADGLSYGLPMEMVPSNSTNVNGQNIEFINSPTNPNILMYSDRRTTDTGQGFGSVVKAIDLSGAAVTLDFQFRADYGAPSNGNGYYDFSYHAPSRSLAVSDFLNNKVYFFEVVPAPGSLALLGLGGLLAARRRR